MSDIERMAELAGMVPARGGVHVSGNRGGVTTEALTRFAELVRAQERERCATLVENGGVGILEQGAIAWVAAAIRST